MIDYIKGKLVELTPTDAVIECGGIGYHTLISLQTYSALENKDEVKVYIHHILREDEEMYYGFADKDERGIFRLLIGVSGVGAGTARMMLSSLSTEEVRDAILSEDIVRIKSIKGIGLKTAQRVIIDLKDKIVKGEASDSGSIPGFTVADSNIVSEATTALVMLGFSKPNVSKAVSSIIKEKPTATLEEIIKIALKKLS